MRKGFVTAVFTLMFCFMTGALFAETLDERLNRLETEIRDLRTQAAQREAQIKDLKAAEAAKAAAAPAAPAAKQNVENLVWTKYNMKLYGRVKIDYNYDTAEFVKYNDFLGAVRAGSSYGNDTTNFNPRDTRIGFEASQIEDNWNILGKIEMDFYGTNADNNLIPRMRLGYVNATYTPTNTSVLAGQDWIPIAQLNPNTVDFGILTAAGNLWWRVPQATVRQKIGDLELLLSAMRHRRTDASVEEVRMPWVMARAAYNYVPLLDKGSYVALGGGYRTDTAFKTYTGASPNGTSINRYVVAAELKLKKGPFVFQAEPWIGQGVGQEFLRYDLDVNYHNSASDPANPQAIQAWGGWADLTYSVNPRWTFTVGYGEDNPKGSDMVGIANNSSASALSFSIDRVFLKNSQAFVNTWYWLTKSLRVGAEFVHVRTERDGRLGSTAAAGNAEGNRYTISTFYEF